MKKPFLILSLTLIVNIIFGQPDTVAYKKIVDKFEAYYNSEKYDSIFTMFSAEMANVVPLYKTKAFFTDLNYQAGKITKIQFVNYQSPYASYKTNFERALLTLNISIDNNSKINGLLIKHFIDDSLPKLEANMTNPLGQVKVKTDTLNFVFEGKKLSGFLDIPVSRHPSAIIIIVPGHVKTNFGGSYWYYDSLFSNFTNLGISCFRYDKAGCGKSEGEYDHNQTVQSSANEIIAAIGELKHRNIKGSDKIGLWSISRGGYVCPLVIQKDSSIAFWISVSGPDGLNSFPFKLQSDLTFAGLPASKAKLFISEWLAQNALIENGGTYEEYVNLKSKQEFRKNDFFMDYMNIDRELPKNQYDEYQKNFKVICKRDKETNIRIIVADFDSILTEINCPVLAIFGEKDYVVDWRKTLSLYKETIGKNNNKKLTIKTFPDGNHSISKCRTGASNEFILNEEFCDGYIETMTTWLKDNNFGKLITAANNKPKPAKRFVRK